jgi:hypothetical protein
LCLYVLQERALCVCFVLSFARERECGCTGCVKREEREKKEREGVEVREREEVEFFLSFFFSCVDHRSSFTSVLHLSSSLKKKERNSRPFFWPRSESQSRPRASSSTSSSSCSERTSERGRERERTGAFPSLKGALKSKREKHRRKMSRRILQKLKAVDFYRKIPT